MNRILTLIAAATCTSTALAGQLERAWVDPEASWMVHVDFQSLMTSQLFKGITDQAGIDLHQLEQQMRAELHDELAGDSDIPPHVLEAWQNINFSVFKDLKSVTVFGTDGHDEPAAVILQTSDAIDEFVATLNPIEGINVTQGENMSFVALREPGAAPGDPEDEHVAAIRNNPLTNDRTIVIAETTAKLIEELDLFARQSAAGQNAGPAWASARPGSYLFVHASEEGLHHLNDEASRILGQTEQVSFEAGESAGQVYADALLQGKDMETVTNVAAIAHGLMAAGRIGLSGQPEGPSIIRLLNAVQISQQGATMNVSFRMEAAAFIDTLKTLQDMHGDDVHIIHSHDSDNDEIEVKVKVETE